MSLASSRSLRCPWQLWGSIWSISWKSVFWIRLEIEPWEPIFGIPLVVVLCSTAKHSTVLGGMISLKGLGNCFKNCPHRNDQHRRCTVVNIVAQHCIAYIIISSGSWCLFQTYLLSQSRSTIFVVKRTLLSLLTLTLLCFWVSSSFGCLLHTFLSPFFHMPDEGAPRLPHAPSAHLCRCSDAPPCRSKWIPTKRRNFCSEAFPSFRKEFERIVQM